MQPRAWRFPVSSPGCLQPYPSRSMTRKQDSHLVSTHSTQLQEPGPSLSLGIFPHWMCLMYIGAFISSPHQSHPSQDAIFSRPHCFNSSWTGRGYQGVYPIATKPFSALWSRPSLQNSDVVQSLKCSFLFRIHTTLRAAVFWCTKYQGLVCRVPWCTVQ